MALEIISGCGKEPSKVCLDVAHDIKEGRSRKSIHQQSARNYVQNYHNVSPLTLAARYVHLHLKKPSRRDKFKSLSTVYELSVSGWRSVQSTLSTCQVSYPLMTFTYRRKGARLTHRPRSRRAAARERHSSPRSPAISLDFRNHRSLLPHCLAGLPTRQALHETKRTETVSLPARIEWKYLQLTTNSSPSESSESCLWSRSTPSLAHSAWNFTRRTSTWAASTNSTSPSSSRPSSCYYASSYTRIASRFSGRSP